MEDEELLRQVEQTLSEIDRSQGLSDEHAEVLAALRIRLHGGPKETLDDVLKAAGKLRGKLLEDVEVPKKKGSLDDVLEKSPKKSDWPS